MSTIGVREIASAVRVLMKGDLARYATSKGSSEVKKLEEELAAYHGTKYSLCVNSGTSALICALVGAGIGPGDEVLVPAYTWVSSAAAPLAVGAIPILVEVDDSLTMSPADIRRKISPYTKAIIPVHMLNLPSDMDAIMAIAAEHNLIVIEDACQAIGATYKGRKLGTIGHVGAFSFQQHKTIQSGEGGAVITNDERIHDRANMYHDVGSYIREDRKQSDVPLFVGVNCRMPEITAALLRPQLRRLDGLMARRRSQRAALISRLSPLGLVPSPHHEPDNAFGVTFRFDSPEDAAAFAKAPGVNRLIDTGRHVYSNWLSVLSRRTQNDKLNPYNWAQREIDTSPTCCPETLEILARTCNIKLLPEYPTLLYRLPIELMAKKVPPQLASRPAKVAPLAAASVAPAPATGDDAHAKAG